MKLDIQLFAEESAANEEVVEDTVETEEETVEENTTGEKLQVNIGGNK